MHIYQCVSLSHSPFSSIQKRAVKSKLSYWHETRMWLYWWYLPHYPITSETNAVQTQLKVLNRRILKLSDPHPSHSGLPGNLEGRDSGQCWAHTAPCRGSHTDADSGVHGNQEGKLQTQRGAKLDVHHLKWRQKAMLFYLYLLFLTMLAEMAVVSWLTLALSGHSVTRAVVLTATLLMAVSSISASGTLWEINKNCFLMA